MQLFSVKKTRTFIIDWLDVITLFEMIRFMIFIVIWDVQMEKSGIIYDIIL